MDLTDAIWRKSTRSSNGGDTCVEIAERNGSIDIDGHVHIRDSKDPHGPSLRVTPDQWKAFTARVRTHEFDGR
jgi:hypothetical protein